MKIRKALATIIAVTTMAVGTSSVSVTATGSNNTISNGASIVDIDEYQSYINGLSEDDLKKIDEKNEIVNMMMNQPLTRAVTKISIPGSFTMYQQTEDNYCIPACIKSALMYIEGSSPAQGTIHESIELHFTRIPEYMNSQQSECTYVLLNSPSQTAMMGCIRADITVEEVPTFMRIYNLSGIGWHYSTDGHCLLVNAFYSDNSRVQFADPAGGLQPEFPYYYEKTAATANSVCTHIVY